MKTIYYTFDTPWAGMSISDEMEVADDATEDEIDQLVREAFFNSFNYGWSDTP